MFANLFTLGRDAEVRYTANGDAVATLALAYNYGRKGQDGRLPTQWIEASIWSKLAESLSPYLLKGGKVFAEIDDLHIETFEKKDGTQGVKLVGKVANIKLAGSKSDAAQDSYEAPQQPAPRQQAPAPRQAAQKPQQPVRGVADMADDSIPF